jgi:protein O-GlcNAc transferase
VTNLIYKDNDNNRPPSSSESLTVDRALQQAIIHHQAGSLQEAERLYHAILQAQPNHPDANHNLGVLAVQVHKPAVSLPYFKLALETNPNQGQYWFSYIDALIKADQTDNAKRVLQQGRQFGISGDAFDSLERNLKQAEPTSLQKAPSQVEENTLIDIFNTERYVEAERLALAMTNTYPDFAVGWMVLGATLRQMGRKEDALMPMQKSVQLCPNDAEAHNNLGVTLKDLGRLEEAETICRCAIALKPDYAEAHSNLGNTLKVLGRLDEAEASYRRALEIKPAFAEAYNSLGATLQDLRRLDEAEASYRRAIALKPDYVEARYNLGVALKDLGRLDEAETSYRQAIALKPNYAEAHSNLGNTMKELGRLGEAESSYRQAIFYNPNFAEAYSNLGVTLNDLGRLVEAEASYRRAIALKPDYAEPYSNLGNTLKELGRLEEAETGYRQAIALKPDYAKAHSNLGATLQDLGRLGEAEASCRQAIALEPDFAEAHSNLLFLSNYVVGKDSAVRLEEARNYGLMVSAKVKERSTTWRCTPRPDRLRVGLVSGDLRNHPVGYFLESILTQLNPASIDLMAYPTINRLDDLTDRIRPRFHSWKPLVGLSDEVAARLIHSDGVHILLDLAGHTAHNKLPLFAWKPAPVQASWLGYFATTGLEEMDYLLGDPYNTPVYEAGHFTETIWRLPEISLCFTPPYADIEVEPLPALSSESITFGCFNNLTKMNNAVVDLWAKVLRAIPHAKLFIKAKQLDGATTCEHTLQRFVERGISPDRLKLEGFSSRVDYLKAYNQVDIALDPFPFPGGTTSAEGLWMGVPVLTKKGDCFISHQGETIVKNAGLPDWIAEDDDDYVAKAVAHTQDLKQLAGLRAGLRQQVLSSPLFDAPRFAKNLETALWGMWEKW